MNNGKVNEKRNKCFQQEMLFSAGVLLKNKIFAFSSSDCLPMTVDLHNGKVAFVNDLVGYTLFYSDEMINDGENIYVFELNGKRLMHFNVNERICLYYDIGCHGEEWGNFAVVAKWRKNLYIFPRYYNKVVVFDCDAQVVTCREGLNMYERENMSKEYKKVWFHCGCWVGGKVWLIMPEGDRLIQYDIKFDIWKQYRLPVRVKKCIHMVDFDNKLYFLGVGGEIYCWDKAGHIIEELAECGRGYEKEFARIVVTDWNIYLLPFKGEDIYVVSRDTGQAKLYDGYPVDFQYCGPEGWSKYYGYCENEDYYFFAMRASAYVLCINKRSGSAEWIKANPPKYEEYLEGCLRYKGIRSESDISVEELLGVLKSICVGGNIYSSVTDGKKIWRKMTED